MNTSLIDSQIATLEANKTKRESANGEHASEKRAAREQALADKRAAKARVREEKRASKPPAHTKVLRKAEAKLPPLRSSSQGFVDALNSIDTEELNSIALHVSHIVRKRSVESSSKPTHLRAGDTVRINVGPPNLIGKTGVIDKVKRIHCYVTVEGYKNPAYLFLNDVERDTQLELAQ